MKLQRHIRSSGDLLADRRYGWAEAALAEGDAAGAAEIIEQALTLVPDFAAAWLLLGKAQAALGARGSAIAAFESALQHDPDDTIGAGLELAHFGARPTGRAMTDAFVRTLFDDYAPRFDTHLTQELSYRAPDLIMAALKRVEAERQQRFRFGRVLDLGCGTGLMGEPIRAHADRLAGCDLSPRMIDQARAKGVYDRLAVDGIEPFLAAEFGRFGGPRSGSRRVRLCGRSGARLCGNGSRAGAAEPFRLHGPVACRRQRHRGRRSPLSPC